MSKFLLISMVLFFSLYSAGSTKYNKTQLLHEHPGLGTKYFVFPGPNGLEHIEIHGNPKIELELSKFYKDEEDLDKQDNVVHTFFAENNVLSNFASKKFQFKRSDITFTLYTRDDKEGRKLKDYDFSKYNVKNPTKVLVHGYKQNGTSDTCITLRDSYLEASDVNVIIIDWGSSAGNLYPLSVISTGSVADYFAEFLAYLINQVKIKEKDLHIIGHSLGAQLAGFTGQRLIVRYGKKASRITALDPAGPLFHIIHVNKKDGEFVDVIHTNRGMLGLGLSVGHIDFYPNGGDSPQPGCETEEPMKVDSCSHRKSWEYFAKSIINEKLYIANCTDNKQHPMGSGTPSDARGICTLETVESPSSQPPNQPFNLFHYICSLFKRLLYSL